ncbi:YopX family protein [Phocaeicola plebeius]|uniref:YopX family protein n=1 Tax=Phocaeicola plebeius TaxID=310297 RepID=UPI003FEF79F2
MNREIKFRGKRKYNCEWVEGDLETNLVPKGSMSKCPAICTTEGTIGSFFVCNDTVGQFTGLKDKNGIDIYEGDIVLQQGYHGKKIPMVVRFECGAFIVGYHNGSSTKRRPMLLNSQCEVIGNVFDNKDLLEE